MTKIHAGLRKLYKHDPIKADQWVFNRSSSPISRRGFLSGLSRMSAILGAEIVFSQSMPSGLIPAALADETEPFRIEGKHPQLVVLNDRPINAETPAHLLDDRVTPADKLFVRNNGIPPKSVDAENWKLTVDGESAVKPMTFSIF